MQFDANALASWVILCTEEAALREQGATQEELDVMKMRVILGMVALLPVSDEEKAALVMSLMSFQRTPVHESVSEDPSNLSSASQ
jgi:hypothetical protein